MLTKNDLQMIGDLFDKKFDEKFDAAFDRKFDEAFDRKFDAAFDRKFDEKISPILVEIREMRKDINELKTDVKEIKEDIKTLQAEFYSFHKFVINFSNHYDREINSMKWDQVHDKNR